MEDQNPLLSTLSPDLVLSGADVGKRYSVDWSAEYAHTPEVVLRPRNTEDVSSILKACHAAGQSIVVQGGMTGLAGGATPQPGEWALSLERMNEVVEIDPAAMTITVGAGTPLEVIQNVAEEAGLRFPLDFGARGSCLAGGVVATNAGGNQVIEFGMARALVLGLTAVLADGTVIPADNKLLKNNSGFDVKQLFIGSEGALGVVTEVTFRVFPKKAGRQTALCALASFDDVITLLQKMGRALDSISSFEVMWSDYYQESLRATGSSDPLGGEHQFYVLVETEGANEETVAETFQSALFAVMEDGLLEDAALAQSRAEEEAFWTIRDGIAELLPDFNPPVTVDVGIPITMMDRFANDVREELKTAKPDCRLLVFGHIGDGNLHMVASTGRSEDKKEIYELIYRKTRDMKGAITAEHGVGMLKKEWLSYSRSDAEIGLMRSLKLLLDSKGILNPGRVI
jgi:FAD/FMN-containing dehydrogenase